MDSNKDRKKWEAQLGDNWLILRDQKWDDSELDEDEALGIGNRDGLDLPGLTYGQLHPMTMVATQEGGEYLWREQPKCLL